MVWPSAAKGAFMSRSLRWTRSPCWPHAVSLIHQATAEMTCRSNDLQVICDKTRDMPYAAPVCFCGDAPADRRGKGPALLCDRLVAASTRSFCPQRDWLRHLVTFPTSTMATARCRATSRCSARALEGGRERERERESERARERERDLYADAGLARRTWFPDGKDTGFGTMVVNLVARCK